MQDVGGLCYGAVMYLTRRALPTWFSGSIVSAALATAGCAATNTEGASSLPELSGPSTEQSSPAPQAGQAAVARALPSFCGGTSNVAPLPTEVSAELIQDGFVFVEGPVWSEKTGSFYFSEMDMDHEGPTGPPAKIHKLTLPMTLSVFVEDSGSNGLAVDDEGLVACTHDQQTLSRYSLETGERTVFVSDFESKHFNSPNDVALHSAGHAYFTDPDWQLAKRPNETGTTGVYWRDPSGKISLIEGSLSKPNGVSLSPDETRLYVGSVSGEISVFPVMADGSVGARKLFAKVDQPDGMAVDCAGNLYVTSHGPGQVVVLSPDAEVISLIKVAPRTTNVAFGGPDRRTLLITAGTGIYSIETAVPGFPY